MRAWVQLRSGCACMSAAVRVAADCENAACRPASYSGEGLVMAKALSEGCGWNFDSRKVSFAAHVASHMPAAIEDVAAEGGAHV